jgi:hypothetical protein
MTDFHIKTPDSSVGMETDYRLDAGFLFPVGGKIIIFGIESTPLGYRSGGPGSIPGTTKKKE